MKTDKEIYNIFRESVIFNVWSYEYYITYQIGIALTGDQKYWDELLENEPRLFSSKKECYAYFKEEFRRIEKEINETWDMTDEEKEEYFERMEQK